MLFNTQLAMGNQAANQQGSSQMNAMQQRMQAQGLGGNSALMNAQIGQQARSTQANQSGLYNNLLLQGGNMRQSAIQGALNYNPQQTGQTNTQQIAGLGTWLPQVVGAGLGAAAHAGMGG
jgi:hypothetical protein